MKVNFVVVDSGPIIKGVILENFSKHAITVPGVIKEIKDLKTRERIRNLPPFFFSIRSPSTEAITHVTQVSKKTGDFKVLSKVDVEVLALAYEMENLKDSDHIDKMFEKLHIDSDIESDDNVENSELEHFEKDSDLESIDVTDSENEEDFNELSSTADINDTEVENVDEKLEETTHVSSLNDNSGWITEENFETMKSENFGFEKEDTVKIDELTDEPHVACLTTDYAMQNVLLHMKIHILSTDGMIIKEPRIFVSWCRSCFKKFRRTDIFFCPGCGNECMGKVPAKIKENGDMELFFRKNFQPNLRNTKFSIPTPKGGKHTDGNTYIYCSDQRLPQERHKKNKTSFDILDDGNVPFIMHDFSSKSSFMGFNNKSHNMKPSKPKGNKGSRRK